MTPEIYNTRGSVLEHALYCVVLLPPGGPGRVVISGSVPFFRESKAIEGGKERMQEISLSGGERVVGWSEREGACVCVRVYATGENQ